jgi:hypothetical protein
MTVIKDALNKAGYDEARHHFLTIVRNMLKQGKTAEWCIGIVREAAAEIPVAVQKLDVQRDQDGADDDRSLLTRREATGPVAERPNRALPPARVPDCPGDQTTRGRNAQFTSVSGAPQSRAADLDNGVRQDQGISVTARPPIASAEAIQSVAKRPDAALPPAREPSDAYLAALIKDRVATARLQLDLRKTHDGRPWSKTGPWEGKGIERDAAIHRAIREVYGPFNPKQERMTYGEFLPDVMFQKALKLVEAHHVG